MAPSGREREDERDLPASGEETPAGSASPSLFSIPYLSQSLSIPTQFPLRSRAGNDGRREKSRAGAISRLGSLPFSARGCSRVWRPPQAGWRRPRRLTRKADALDAEADAIRLLARRPPTPRHFRRLDA